MMSRTARLPWDPAGSKIQEWHRDRLAVVYVRQSTMAQVIEHGESTRLQYGLSGRAAELGWEPSRVLVIDEDLGHSASGTEVRPGFQRLVSEVGLDHVGIVLGIEMSRLARSGREWHQLLELCALSGALLGDQDGVYDPAEHNDRLLLGVICPRLTAVVNVINGPPLRSYPSLMILYLSLAGNVGNEGAGGSASPALAGYARDLAAPPAPSATTPR